MMTGRCIYIFLGLQARCKLYTTLTYTPNTYVLLIDTCNDLRAICNLLLIATLFIRPTTNLNPATTRLLCPFLSRLSPCLVTSFDFGNYFIGDVEYTLRRGTAGVALG